MAKDKFLSTPIASTPTPSGRFSGSCFGKRRVKRLYFTGMLTHGQSEFFIQYIDPDSHTVRSYYPDFLFERQDGVFVIVEVKADNQIEDAIVQAKMEFAQQIAVASGMEYRMIKASDANDRRYRMLM
jgi:type III restriction enzyme